jgi:hypothetical protein
LAASSRKKIKKGSLIRFRCQGDEVLTRVTRVARYANFDEMFDRESVTSVNPLATREELANIRIVRAGSPHPWVADSAAVSDRGSAVADLYGTTTPPRIRTSARVLAFQISIVTRGNVRLNC